jgi:hypothetical protein
VSASTTSLATFMMDPEADPADSNGVPEFDVVAEPGAGVRAVVGEPSSAMALLRLLLMFMISSPSGYK